MPTIFLLPYLPLSETCVVGSWRLLPRRTFSAEDAADEAEAEIIRQLFNLYQLERNPQDFGCVARPTDGAEAEQASIPPLHRAVLATLLDSNPELDRRAGSISGHLVCTAENATVYGHPVTRPDAIVGIQTGAMVRTTTMMPLGLPPGQIKPPTDLPQPAAPRRIDGEYATAVHQAVSADTAEGRRVGLAIDWLGLAWTNTPSMTEALRIVALYTGFESAVGVQGTMNVRQAVARLIDPAPGARRTGSRPDGRPQTDPLSDFEWWFAWFSSLRNAVIHGDATDDGDFAYQGERHLWLAEGHLRRLIRKLVADAAGNDRLLLSEMDRALERAADAFMQDVEAYQRRRDDHG